MGPECARRTLLAGALAIGLVPGFAGSTARAQDAGPIGSLGGYGAMAGTPGSSMGGLAVDPSGMGAAALAPFGGRFGGVMTPRMGGGGPLAFSERSSAMMSRNRPSFTIGPMGGGMPSMAAGGAPAFGRRPFALRPLDMTGGLGRGAGMPSMSESRGMGVMPPSFGYPFRQPPSLLPGSPSGAGMSM